MVVWVNTAEKPMAAAEPRREDENPSATPLPNASDVKKTGAAVRMICSCPKQPENEDFAAPRGVRPGPASGRTAAWRPVAAEAHGGERDERP